VKGGEGLPLLDLLVGNADASGSEIYLRKNNQDEVRSGQDKLSTYVKSSESSWYDLKLFQGSEQLSDITMVQRISIYPPPPADAGEESVLPVPVVLNRNNTGGWIVEGRDDLIVDVPATESYLRNVLSAEGENFVPGANANDPMYNEGRVVLELGNRTSRTIGVGPLEGAKRNAAASGSPYVFLLAEWTLGRIFRDIAYFTGQTS
jgi:hypothetical protein